MIIQSLGPIISGNDVIISSATGTGKTFAYLIPIIESLLNHEKYSQPQPDSEQTKRGAIVLTATKELCAQAYADFKKITSGLSLKACRTGSLTHISPLVDHLVCPFNLESKNLTFLETGPEGYRIGEGQVSI